VPPCLEQHCVSLVLAVTPRQWQWHILLLGECHAGGCGALPGTATHLHAHHSTHRWRRPCSCVCVTRGVCAPPRALPHPTRTPQYTQMAPTQHSTARTAQHSRRSVAASGPHGRAKRCQLQAVSWRQGALLGAALLSCALQQHTSWLCVSSTCKAGKRPSTKPT
jgi:hypothetical protein